MPTLDVSDVLLDPDIADRFTVFRRAQSVSAYGRTITTPTRFDGVVGVVNSAGKNDLARLAETQLQGRHLSIVTRWRLRGVSKDYQPDIIFWQDNYYLVQLLDPYPQYGQGFVQAVVGSIDSTDKALEDLPASDSVFGGVANAS